MKTYSIRKNGKNVFKGYYQQEELTKSVKIKINGQEYYNTGTLGFIDEDGYFTPTGRKSRFYINSSLNKVYCDYVQNVIASFDCVKDCAVVPTPDEDELYVNKAYIVLKEEYHHQPDIIDYLKELLNQPTKVFDDRMTILKDYEKPKYIEFVTVLPRISGSDKIDYSYLENSNKFILERARHGRI